MVAAISRRPVRRAVAEAIALRAAVAEAVAPHSEAEVAAEVAHPAVAVATLALPTAADTAVVKFSYSFLPIGPVPFSGDRAVFLPRSAPIMKFT